MIGVGLSVRQLVVVSAISASDAAHSDILIVPAALGLECKMLPGKGPCFTTPLTREAVETLPAADAPSVHEHLHQMMQTISVTRHRLGGYFFFLFVR